MKPEHWRTDAADAAFARLDIPADAQRERHFEISVTAAVGVPDAGQPWLQLRVEADGLLQWQRRVPGHAPADGLDYRFRRSVPVGRALRLLARVETGGGARRRTLVLQAEEV